MKKKHTRNSSFEENRQTPTAENLILLFLLIIPLKKHPHDFKCLKNFFLFFKLLA